MQRLPLTLSAAGIAIAAFVGDAVADDPSGPFRLSAAQLDSLTAGLLVIEVMAVAEASGPNPATFTEAETNVVQRGAVEIGWGAGTAVAVGEDPTAVVLTSYAADGILVLAFVAGDRAEGANFAAEHETLFVVSFADLGKKKNPVKVGKKGNVVVKGALKGKDKKFVHQAAKAIDPELHRAVRRTIR